jgi:hypothetical protein
MAITYTAIQNVTIVTATNEIEFTSIPSTYTDLVIKWSIRSTENNPFTDQGFRITFNGTTSGYSNNLLYGNAGSFGAGDNSSQAALQWVYATGATASTYAFSNGEMYIPNYAGSNRKAHLSDSVAENDSASNYVLAFTAGRTTITSAITSIKLATSTGNWVQHSSAILYGIKKA